jgi:hypothetical protein
MLRGNGCEVSTLAKDEDGDRYLIACPGSGGAMSGTETVCSLDWNGTPEWEANARLIAAAPDLLAACKQAAELFEDDEGIAQVLLAAIANATGEAP